MHQTKVDAGARIKAELEAAEVSTEQLEALDNAIDQLAETGGALIPVLQVAQNLLGYLPQPVLKHIALRLGKPYSEVAGVVTFYSYFSTVPRGKNIVRACMGTACYVRGGKEVLQALRDTLGIEVGETTADRQFSLEVGRCFGACGLAPVVMVGDDVHQRVKPARVREIIAGYAGAEGDSEEKKEATE